MFPKTWFYNIEPDIQCPVAPNNMIELQHQRDVRFLDFIHFYDGPIDSYGLLVKSGDIVVLRMPRQADYWRNRPYFIFELTTEEQKDTKRLMELERHVHKGTKTIPYSASGRRLPRNLLHPDSSIRDLTSDEKDELVWLMALETALFKDLSERPPSGFMFENRSVHRRRRSLNYFLKYQN